MDPYKTIKYISMTEKSVQGIEKSNKIVFIVDIKSTKSEIKKSVEVAFESDVKNVRTLVDQKGKKKAFVRFKKDGAAGEIAIKLGII